MPITAAFGNSIIVSLAFLTCAAEARIITLKPGTTTVSKEYVVAAGDTLRGAPGGSVLRASDTFQGRAIVVLGSGSTLEGMTIDGNRSKLERPTPIAPYDQAFADFYPNNGVLSAGTRDVTIRSVKLLNVVNFAVLISGARNVRIERVEISDSGSMNTSPTPRNNTTGGILLEEGTVDFTVRDCILRNVRGNGIWTHSRYTSERNARGLIIQNHFYTIGRDALQAGHATEMRIERNTGDRIGFPFEIVDVEGGGMPVAIDTAGNVDKSSYSENTFEEINGKCIDLDGFHHGDVRRNVCRNRLAAGQYPSGHFGIVFNNTNPDMQSEEVRVIENVIDGTKFGAIFVIGRGHTISRNRFLRINLAGCNESHAKFGCLYNAEEPDVLQSGIYLGKRAERPDPARENTITDNVISGFMMSERCIKSSPGVALSANRIERNTCQSR